MDPRWQVAMTHPELNLKPPPLFTCPQDGCRNTVLTENEYCGFHWAGPGFTTRNDESTS